MTPQLAIALLCPVITISAAIITTGRNRRDRQRQRDADREEAATWRRHRRDIA